MDAHACAAYAVFSPQECSSIRHADIRLHEKSRDTLAAMGTVAACGQYAVDYLIGNIGRVPLEHIQFCTMKFLSLCRVQSARLL